MCVLLVLFIWLKHIHIVVVVANLGVYDLGVVYNKKSIVVKFFLYIM